MALASCRGPVHRAGDGMAAVAEDFSVNVDFAVLRGGDDQPLALLAWGDRVRVLDRTTTKFEAEITTWRAQRDGSIKPVAVRGFLKRRIRAGGASRQVALPEADVRVLSVSFVDVQQGDGTLIQTPGGKVITIDAGENQLFARFLASRFPGTSATERLPIDAMVVSHGDADHFSGLTEIHRTETAEDIAARKRLFVHPRRVFHNGLVKRPTTVPEAERLGEISKVGDRTIITGVVDSPLDVPAAQMNKPFKEWRKALQAWEADRPIEYRRLAAGMHDAFAFLAEEGIAVEVLGPLEAEAGGARGLELLREPKKGKPLAHLDFEPGGVSASHTINGHSVVLRLQIGNVRMLFGGDLNNASEEALLAEHVAGRIDLQAEVLKVPHHGSHEFTPGFLGAVSPVVSVVSSGDESSRTEYIHPRATLMSALGRHARDEASVVFVTELVAFFEVAGWVVPSPSTPPKPGAAKPTPFFGFKRTAFGLVRVRTDGQRLLVFSDTGKRDVKEAYAYDLPQPGILTPSLVQRA